MADTLAEKGLKTTSFSVTGTATWSQGFSTSTEIIDKSGVVRFNKYEIWGDVISNITSQVHGNVYCQEYMDALEAGIDSSESLGKFLEDVKLETRYKTDTTLSKQLYQVARLIATRHERKAERDFFFVELGGFDTHKDIQTQLPDRFEMIDNALRAFVTELQEANVFDQVVTITQSDF